MRPADRTRVAAWRNEQRHGGELANLPCTPLLCTVEPVEQALTLIGQVADERKCFDLFESLASEMQCREWQRIVRLVDAAETSGRRELAVSVFRCALENPEGFHADYLAKKLDQLLRGKWKPD